MSEWDLLSVAEPAGSGQAPSRPPTDCSKCLDKRCRRLFQQSKRSDPVMESLIKRVRIGRQFAAANTAFHLENDPNTTAAVLYDGWAKTYQTLSDGRRHVLRILIPGDVIRLPSVGRRRLDFGCEAITTATACTFQFRELSEIPDADTALYRILYRNISGLSKAECEIHHAQTTGLRHRDAEERVAYFLFEQYRRLKRRGLAPQGQCFFPVTQTTLGEATGLALGSVNRILKDLRAARVVDLSRRRLSVLDHAGLADRAGLARPKRDLPVSGKIKITFIGSGLLGQIRRKADAIPHDNR